MKGEKIKVIIIYFLILVIIALCIYLIYFTLNQNKENKVPEEPEAPIASEALQIADECIFDVTLDQFNSLATDNKQIELCDTYNKINITDTNLSSIYYNGVPENENNELGIYMNDSQIIEGASDSTKNTIYLVNNKVFIKSDTGVINLLIYNNEATQIYDLNSKLEENQVEDPVFAELAKTDQNQNTKLNISDIDSNTYNFADDYFTFSTITKECAQGQTHKGSNYKVAYANDNFENPVFESYIDC